MLTVFVNINNLFDYIPKHINEFSQESYVGGMVKFVLQIKQHAHLSISMKYAKKKINNLFIHY